MLVTQCPCTECMAAREALAKRVSVPTGRNTLSSLDNTVAGHPVVGALAVVPPPATGIQEGAVHWSDAGYKAQPAPTSTGGMKHDGDKPRMDLLPGYSLEEISKVLSFGATKYASWNWSRGIAYSRLLGAALRHLFAWARGEDRDPESGLSHLAHAGCCVLFMLWMEKHRSDLDDRGKDPTQGES